MVKQMVINPDIRMCIHQQQRSPLCHTCDSLYSYLEQASSLRRFRSTHHPFQLQTSLDHPNPKLSYR